MSVKGSLRAKYSASTSLVHSYPLKGTFRQTKYFPMLIKFLLVQELRAQIQMQIKLAATMRQLAANNVDLEGMGMDLARNRPSLFCSNNAAFLK